MPKSSVNITALNVDTLREGACHRRSRFLVYATVCCTMPRPRVGITNKASCKNSRAFASIGPCCGERMFSPTPPKSASLARCCGPLPVAGLTCARNPGRSWPGCDRALHNEQSCMAVAVGDCCEGAGRQTLVQVDTERAAYPRVQPRAIDQFQDSCSRSDCIAMWSRSGRQTELRQPGIMP